MEIHLGIHSRSHYSVFFNCFLFFVAICYFFIICQTASKNIHYLSFCIYLAPFGLPAGFLRFTATNMNVKYLFLLLPTGGYLQGFLRSCSTSVRCLRTNKIALQLVDQSNHPGKFRMRSFTGDVYILIDNFRSNIRSCLLLQVIK